MAINKVPSEGKTPAPAPYNPLSMKARLGLDVTMQIKEPSGVVKSPAPVDPAQFANQASAMPMLNNANQVAGEAMRLREINSGVGESNSTAPSVVQSLQEKAKDGVARQSPGQTKKTIFGD